MKVSSKLALKSICVSGIVVGASTLGMNANAAEQIFLSYKGSEINVGRQELESFTDTGILPSSIQTLLGTDTEIPGVIRTLLTREIRIPIFVEKFLNSSTGEFVLSQLDSAIGSTTSRTEKDLIDLKTAINSAASDQTLSFMELVRKYPQRNVRVDLTNLEGTYNDVSNFVERVAPALEVAKGFLEDIVCDCKTTSAASLHSAPRIYSSTAPTYSSAGKPCNEAEQANLAIAPSPHNVMPTPKLASPELTSPGLASPELTSPERTPLNIAPSTETAQISQAAQSLRIKNR